MAQTPTQTPPRRLSLRKLHDNLKRYPIEIGSSDRVFTCGQSRSGKTTFMLDLLRSYGMYTIIDPKQDNTIPDVPILQQYDPEQERQIIRYPFSKDNKQVEWRWYDDVFTDIFFDRRPGIVYDDEVTATVSGPRMPPGMGRLVRQGGGIGIGFWSASQRPKDVPNALLTEALHFFIFRLTNPDDIKKIASFTDSRVINAIPRDNYDCLYYDVNTHRLLKIPGK